MRILGFCLGYWHDEKLSNYSCQPPALRLPAWRDSMKRLLSPIGLFIASGTHSNPAWNPIPDVPIVQAGAPYDRPYEGNFRHFGKCAMAAAMAHALNRDDWDVLVHFDTDALWGAIDLDALFKEFMARPETLMAPGWIGYPGGPLTAWKRDAVVRTAHYRQTANLRDSDEGIEIIWEKELLHIFRGGRWWNPWPTLRTCMNDGTPERISWPMISKCPADFVDEYARLQSIHTKPIL